MADDRRKTQRAPKEPPEDAIVGPVPMSIDPTVNVKEMVRLEVQRQDDLRWAEARAVRELMAQRDGFEARISKLIQDHLEQLAEKETQRLDAIRAVDRDAVTRAAEVSAAQAQTLAATVATSAEALRGQVEAQRVTTADALAAALGPITTRLDGLLAAQFARQGVEATKTEQRRQADVSTGAIIGGVAALISFLGLVIAVIVLVTR